MKRLILTAALLCGFGASCAFAQEDFRFNTIISHPVTSIKNQNQTGTCWCFSTISFLESELMRMGKGEHDLCEMFVVGKTMLDRARTVVDSNGKEVFYQGGSHYDVMYCLKNYGLCPQSAMPEPGSLYGENLPVHNELDALAAAYVKARASMPSDSNDNWINGLKGIYEAYIGEMPERFTIKGIEHTPMSYAKSLGLNADDYVSLTSYTHHPFYEKFALEVSDNWRRDLSWNLPLEELLRVFDNAIDNGYTIAWSADVSEPGKTDKGLMICPDKKALKEADGPGKVSLATIYDISGRDFKYPVNEIKIDQEIRQKAFDKGETTDDHAMHIFGKAKDQGGKDYFMVKNSWGTEIGRDGIWYASRAYIAYKTMNIVVHKDAIPADIRAKLGI